MSTKDCYEAVAEVDEAMRSCLQPDQRYYALGGIPTSAIRHEETVFDFENRALYPVKAAADPLHREENGTVRDIDLLIDDVLPKERTDEIVAKLQEVTDLVVSVFTLEERKEQPEKFERVVRTLGDWTSRRTIDEHGIIRYELFPLEQAVQPESFEPWTLHLPQGQELSMFSPPAHMLAYRMRSISGVRDKDVKKLDEMTDAIMAIPEFSEQITDGIYREWLDFALATYRVLDGKLGLDDPILTTGCTERDLAFFALKGRALGSFESNKHIRKIAQSPIGEKVLSPFTRTK